MVHICCILFNKYVFIFTCIIILYKIWMKFTTRFCTSKKCMAGKTVIITGGNAGIGKETALDLATRGARLILACRDPTRAGKALDEITARTGNTQILYHHLDLASLDSVRKFASTIIKTEDRLDVLVNNAGMGGVPGTAFSKEMQHTIMQVNHYGHFLLTVLLLDLLKKSAPSRVVVVSSWFHKMAPMTVESLDNERSDAFTAYSDSKLANILMANELTRRLKGTGVTVNSLHPGMVDTPIWGGSDSSVIRNVHKYFHKHFCKTPTEGAQTSLHVVLSDSLEGVSGKYFSECQEQQTSRAAQDELLALKLWEKSVEVVSLKPDEKSTLNVNNFLVS